MHRGWLSWRRHVRIRFRVCCWSRVKLFQVLSVRAVFVRSVNESKEGYAISSYCFV